MILVDTSVWIEFFRGNEGAEALGSLLHDNEVLLHLWVLGELALGGLGSRRPEILADSASVPAALCVPDPEVLDLVLTRRLFGRGIGWVDAHLAASCLVGGCALWTFDKALRAAAGDLEIERFP